MKAETTGTGKGRLFRNVANGAGDVCMVLAWAAMIPGLMWLGAAAGF